MVVFGDSLALVALAYARCWVTFYRLTFPRLRVAWMYVGSAVSSLGYSCVTGDGACPNYTIGGVGMVFLYVGITKVLKILAILSRAAVWS